VETAKIQDGAVTFAKIDGAAIASQAEAEAGTSSTDLMTPERTEQHMVANALGWGQTYQDMSASRAHSTSYQNTTGRPIFVSIRATDGTGRAIQVSPDNSAWLPVGVTVGSGYRTTNFVVPNGYYYRINGTTTIEQWVELR
jgi:hypothetical protein